jgi:hypothetical protein
MRRVIVVVAMIVALTVGCRNEEKLSVTTCQLDDGPQVLCVSPITYNDLPPGPHHVVVRAVILTYRDGVWHQSETGEDSWSWVVEEG